MKLDFCDECGMKTLQSDLVRMMRRWQVTTSSNYIPYSRYSSSGWACDATDQDAISLGPLGHNSIAYIDESSDTHEKQGSQAWKGSGTFRTVTTAVDVSGFTSLVLSAQVGAHHYGAYQSLTVAFGFCDSAGANKDEQQSLTVTGSRECWFYATPSDIGSPLSSAAAYFYFDITCDDSSQVWYVDAIRLEKDLTRPSNVYLNTVGTAKDYTSDQVKLGTGKICPQCVEALKTLTFPNIVKERPAPPVRVRMEKP